jgi:hypothetical protein
MNIEELTADIRATFPGVETMKRKSSTGNEHWMLAAEEAQFPDGLKIFCDCAGCHESGSHDAGVHLGFAAWLESRGFYLEREDEFWFVPTEIPTPEEIAEWHANYAIASAKRADVIDGGCPF